METNGPSEFSSDERYIHEQIELARQEDREITDPVARAIASRWHGGQTSPLYSFASTGRIDLESLTPELMGDYLNEYTTDTDRIELDALTQYLTSQGDREAVPDWHNKAKWDLGEFTVRRYGREDGDATGN